MTRAAASKSQYGTMSAPGVSGENGVLYWSLAVSASAPSVRPWKLPPKLTSSCGAAAAGSYGSMPAVAAHSH